MVRHSAINSRRNRKVHLGKIASAVMLDVKDDMLCVRSELPLAKTKSKLAVLKITQTPRVVSIFIHTIPQFVAVVCMRLAGIKEFDTTVLQELFCRDLFVSPVCISFNDVCSRAVQAARTPSRNSKLADKHVHTNARASRPTQH